MTLATATPAGAPSARIVLLRGCDERGFAFFTNFDSRKGDELFANPAAALTFHWKSLQRQVRIEGRVETVSDAEADAYFARRARMSQIGAWASDQSRELDSRATFERRTADMEKRFWRGSDSPPPALVRLPRRADTVRVLGGAPFPVARPAGLSPGRRGMGEGQAVSIGLSSPPFRFGPRRRATHEFPLRRSATKRKILDAPVKTGQGDLGERKCIGHRLRPKLPP